MSQNGTATLQGIWQNQWYMCDIGLTIFWKLSGSATCILSFYFSKAVLFLIKYRIGE